MAAVSFTIKPLYFATKQTVSSLLLFLVNEVGERKVIPRDEKTQITAAKRTIKACHAFLKKKVGGRRLYKRSLGFAVLVRLQGDLPWQNQKNCKIHWIEKSEKLSLLLRVINCPADHCLFQSDIDNIYRWSLQNRMEFSVKKCKLMRICKKKKDLSFSLIYISIIALWSQHLISVILGWLQTAISLGAITLIR